MSNPHGIIVFGANGSGKTTWGRELARILGYKHMDHEEYCFKESEIPYTNARSDEESLRLMLADIKKHGAFVLSSCTGDFGAGIPQFYEFAIYLSAPLGLRMDRINRREYDKFGDRVREGGDMYAHQLKFHAFVAARSLSKIEQWAETLTCPVIRVDGTKDYRQTAAQIAAQFYGVPTA
ncbi:MAG: AAA family ATPase [Clostridiales bacterium]|nr:AAA family ATPase [Clostridiales bacterium]